MQHTQGFGNWKRHLCRCRTLSPHQRELVEPISPDAREFPPANFHEASPSHVLSPAAPAPLHPNPALPSVAPVSVDDDNESLAVPVPVPTREIEGEAHVGTGTSTPKTVQGPARSGPLSSPTRTEATDGNVTVGVQCRRRSQ